MNKTERIMLYTLGAIQFVNIMDFMIMMPLGPSLISRFGIEPSDFGLLVSSYSISAFISGIITTFIINKFDKDSGISINDYEKIIGTKVEKVFSKDENSLRNAQLKGKLLVNLAANAKFSQEITEWANEWLGKKKDKSLWHRLGIK